MNNLNKKINTMTEQTEIMTDEIALTYAIEALLDLDEHCVHDEQRAKLAEAISVLSSMLDTYQSMTKGASK